MRHTSAILAATIAVVASTLITPAIPGNANPPMVTALAAPAVPKPMKIVLLGDSYSAGNGAGNYDGHCYRSRVNWAQRYVTWLNQHGHQARLINRACSEAITTDVTGHQTFLPITVSAPVRPHMSLTDQATIKADLVAACQQYPEEAVTITNAGVNYLRGAAVSIKGQCTRRIAAQIDAVGKDTDLVMLTIGGDDVDFHDIVAHCFAVSQRHPDQCRKLIDHAEANLATVGQNTTALLTKLRAKLRPEAKVALLTYPYLSSRASWRLRNIQATFGFGGDSYDAGAAVRKLGDDGDAMQRTAVQAANKRAKQNFVTLVDGVKAAFAGHEPDPDATERNPDRWINEFLEPGLDQGEWYHPNGSGHEGYKDVLIKYGDFSAAPTAPAKAGSIDLAFVIDATGSMQPTIDLVKAQTHQMVALLAARTASYRFGLVTYRDEPSYTGSDIDYPARVDVPFTTSRATIDGGLSAIVADGGGDTPETVYSGLVAAIGLPWRPGVKKVLLLIGDAPPHDPEPVSHLTQDDVVRDALAVDPAEVYPIDASGVGALGGELTAIAAATGGTTGVGSSDKVDQTVLKTITAALSKPYAWAGGPYVGRLGTPVLLDASGSFDSDGTIVSYAWDVDGNGSYERKTTAPHLTHTWLAPFIGNLAVRVTDKDGNTSIATAHVAMTRDGDEVDDQVDNCPTVANPGQDDTDQDGIGDACETDPRPSADQPGVFPADAPGPAATSAIDGAVFRDHDGDGRRGHGDGGIAAVTIELTGVDAGGEPVSRSTTTDIDGQWAFATLLPGRYTVREIQPAGLVDGADSLGLGRNQARGGSAGAIGPDQMTDIVLSGFGSRVDGYGFGEGPVDAGGAWSFGPWWWLSAVLGGLLVLGGLVGLQIWRRSRAGRAEPERGHHALVPDDQRR